MHLVSFKDQNEEEYSTGNWMAIFFNIFIPGAKKRD
jgi:hypothetical protein